jgi:hypothetical protein
MASANRAWSEFSWSEFSLSEVSGPVKEKTESAMALAVEVGREAGRVVKGAWSNLSMPSFAWGRRWWVGQRGGDVRALLQASVHDDPNMLRQKLQVRRAAPRL